MREAKTLQQILDKRKQRQWRQVTKKEFFEECWLTRHQLDLDLNEVEVRGRRTALTAQLHGLYKNICKITADTQKCKDMAKQARRSKAKLKEQVLKIC